MTKKVITSVQKQVLEGEYVLYIVRYSDGKKTTSRTYNFYTPATVEQFIQGATAEVVDDYHLGSGQRYTCTHYEKEA